jgi:hypothetical protein
MNTEDAEKAINIIMTADGKCRFCAQDLLLKLSKAFPEHKSLCEKLFKENFDCDLKDEN